MQYIKENYERLWAKSLDQSSYGKPTELVIKLADSLSSGNVLDLGAGDGRQALYLASKGFAVTAVDLSQAGLNKLQSLAQQQGVRIQTELADLHTWTIAEEYNAILAIAVLQHLQHTATLRLLEDMKLHTAPGGMNALTVFTKSGDRYALDQTEDPGAFYPEDNWLKQFYSDWEIIEHDLITTSEIRTNPATGLPLQNTVERLLARKPI